MKVKILSWNINGLNGRKKRSTLVSLVRKWKADILCLQETKMEVIPKSLLHQIWGSRWVDWVELKTCGTSGGIIIIWDKRMWNCIDSHQGNYTITCMLESLQEDFRWCFTGLYGPHTNSEGEELWQELGAIRGIWSEQWVIGGDFNVCRFRERETQLH